MKTYFKNVHPDVPTGLITRAEKKIDKLSKLMDEGRFEAQAYVEISKATGAQHSEAAWRASINVDMQGERFHAEAVQGTPQKATDQAIAEMQSELRTYHERERTERRKGGTLFKMLQQRDLNPQ